MAAAAVPVPKPNCAIPHVPIDALPAKVDMIVDNLKAMQQLANLQELSINVVSIVVGSYVSKMDFDNPSDQYPRNHECTALMHNLLQNPSVQISPAFLEYVRCNGVQTVNINQYVFLFDPMYSREDCVVPYGLEKRYPSILYNPIISTTGFIMHDAMLQAPVKYNSMAEPYIIPDSTNEFQVASIIEQFQKLSCNSLLINVMDCTSNTLRKMWMHNAAPNVYLTMPDCLAKDYTPMYMPVITYSHSTAQDHGAGAGAGARFRWINWSLDSEFASVYQLVSPHTYEFLIHNYKRIVLETYFMPICKILGRMRVSIEQRLDEDTTIVFSKMGFQQFKELWHTKRAAFSTLFMSYIDTYYKWNCYKFIRILLEEHNHSQELNMQTILLDYLRVHLLQLRAFFPSEPLSAHIATVSAQIAIINSGALEGNCNEIQILLSRYLNENGMH